MKKILTLFSILLAGFANAQQCLHIESILVDACVPGGGCTNSQSPNCNCEGKNEMVLFKVGSSPINTASLTVAWPNNSFKGWKQNAQTAANVSALNSTIVSCGYLKEPAGGILPAKSEVLIITSWDMCTTANSFANLQDTLIVLFQDTGNYQGHFANTDNNSTITTVPTGTPSVRTLTLNYPPLSCSQSVQYDRSLLVNNMGTYGGTSGQNDGSTVFYDTLGNATYANEGCKVPYIPILVDAGTNASVCFNSSVNLSGTVSGPYASYSWSGGTGSFGNPGSLNTTYSPAVGDAGTITLYLTAHGKCSTNVVKDSLQLTIKPAPSPTVTSGGGNTICSGNSIVLSVNNQGSTTYSWSPGGSTATSVTVSPSSQTVYSVDATNACATTTAMFTVNVNALPVITVVNDSVCPGGTGTLNASGASTYTWSTSASGSSISASPSSTTQYTVTGTDNNGCVNTGSGEIFVYTPPTVSVNSSSVCPTGSVTLTAGGALSYTWSTSQGGSTITVSPSVTTVYTVSGSDAKGCVGTATSTVTIFNPPVVTATSSTICPGNAATLNASGASTYTWSTGSNAASVTVTPASNSTYSVIGADANGCLDTAYASVNIVSTLTVSATPANLSVCIGSSTTIQASGANTYTWSPASTLNASTGTSVTATPTANTTYTVIGSSGSCADTTTVTVNIMSLPTITASTNSPSVCAGSSVILTGGGGISYNWTGGAANGVPFVPNATQTYTVTGTDNNGCKNTATVTVVVDQLPVITVSPATVCLNNSATITASGASTYTWSTSATGGSINVSPLSSTGYTVSGTDANGCVGTGSGTVTVNPLPNVTSSSFATCPNSTVSISATGAVTYTWSTGQNGSSISVPGTAATYTVVGTDANGCSNMAVATVTLLPMPSAQSVGGNSVICNGQSTVLSVSSPGNYVYSWTGPSGPLGTGPSMTVGQQGTYTVTASNSCGSVSATYSVTVSNPQAAFTSDHLSGEAPLSVVFVNASTGTQLQNYWIFSNGDTSHHANPSENFSTPGNYNVELIVTDVNGCMDTALVTILVTETPVVVTVPNVFSPNDDGINDVFMIKAAGVTGFNCKIYDRWGLLLYEWSTPAGGWDGKNATDGTYYYIFTYTDHQNKAISKPGYILLVR